MNSPDPHPELTELAQGLRRQGSVFVIATVLRTFGATAAKPGAKALLLADGTIAEGWLGGNCVHSALSRAARQAMEEGTPQMISIHPQSALDEKGVTAGENIDGVRFDRNGCPSNGSMDIFVEPVLPMPELVIFGTSPVAVALGQLAKSLHWAVITANEDAVLNPPLTAVRRMVVVATQGREDAKCLRAAIGCAAEFVAFVGSRRKFQELTRHLVGGGIEPEALNAVAVPAGIAINAVTPEEIALSIMADLTRRRRADQRRPAGGRN
ncbi:MAG: XdhC family protein [Rhodobacteraceae bacterium]|nr:XdhC family protein [Paracoccaceae bacterium]